MRVTQEDPSSAPVEAAPPAPTNVAAPTPRRGWSRRLPLKLMSALRGEGTLIWSNLAMPAAYELDIYAAGAVRSMQGNLEGDFSGLVTGDEPGDRRLNGARLKLDDGREIEIDLTDLDPSYANFEGQGAPS
jgi:hypothetical protein